MGSIKRKKRSTMKLLELIQKAEKYGWTNQGNDSVARTIQFTRYFEDTFCEMSVGYTDWSVLTTLIHPKKGKTTLRRDKVSRNEIKCLFINPRHHTGKGTYQEKGVFKPHHKRIKEDDGDITLDGIDADPDSIPSLVFGMNDEVIADEIRRIHYKSGLGGGGSRRMPVNDTDDESEGWDKAMQKSIER